MPYNHLSIEAKWQQIVRSILYGICSGICFCGIAVELFAQIDIPLRIKKVYSNTAASGEIVVTFCDSIVTGKFIGSPNHMPFDFSSPAPKFDGWLSGKRQGNKWVGRWYDNRFSGDFVVRFLDGYSKFEGEFYRNQNRGGWQKIYGNEMDEWLTIEGKRSVVWAGVTSFFVPGSGQYYNREYDKFIIYRSIHALGGVTVLSGFFTIIASAIQTLGQPYPQPLQPGQMPSAPQQTNTPQSTFETGLVLLVAGASIVGVTMVAASIDAIISANRINAEMDSQPIYQCANSSPHDNFRLNIELTPVNRAYLPQVALSLGLHIIIHQP